MKRAGGILVTVAMVVAAGLLIRPAPRKVPPDTRPQATATPIGVVEHPDTTLESRLRAIVRHTRNRGRRKTSQGADAGITESAQRAD